MNICIVCLRTDRPIKPNNGLTEFHKEICDITAFIGDACCLYCSECECKMVKFYKFKQKCMEASKLYQEWMAGEIKNPIHSLYKLLSPSTLSMWNVNSRKIGTFYIQSREQSNIDNISKLHMLIKHESNLQHVLTDSINSINDQQGENFPVTGPDRKLTKEVEVKVEHLITEQENKNNIENMHSIDIKENKNFSDSSLEPDCLEEEYDLIKNEIHVTEDSNQQNVKYEKSDILSTDETKVLKKLKSLRKRKTSVAVKKPNVGIKKMVAKNDQKDVEMKYYESCKELLTKKLSSFGDVTTDSGVAINMELITKFIQNYAGPSTLRSLRQAICRKGVTELSPDIKEKFITIQNNHDKYGKMNEDKKYYSSIFDIQYLRTKEEKLQEFERRQTYEAYVRAQFKCQICYQPFRGSQILKSHMKNFHDASGGGRCCEICHMWVGGARKRDRHTHSVVYKCKLCPLVTYHSYAMKVHAEKHRGKVYHCDQCDMSFKGSSTYYSHIASQHKVARAVCQVCGRGFPSQKSLLVHTSIKHRDTSPGAGVAEVRCEQCDVTLPAHVFKAHVMDVHKPPAPQPKSEDTTTKTVRHRGPRTTPIPMQTCRVCNLSQQGAAWLKPHYKRAHPDVSVELQYGDKSAHLCDTCGAVYYTALGLRDHMLLHSGTRPFACDLCPKRFRRAIDMSNHRLYHFPPALPCTHCGKKYHTKSNLYGHMKSHELTERDYKCQYCDKGFFTNCTLNEHIRGVHFNVRRVRKRGGGEGAGRNTTKARRRKNTVPELDEICE